MKVVSVNELLPSKQSLVFCGGSLRQETSPLSLFQGTFDGSLRKLWVSAFRRTHLTSANNEEHLDAIRYEMVQRPLRQIQAA